MRIFCLLLLAAFATGCSSDSKNLAAASGQAGDIYVIMDSLQRKGPVGKVLDSILNEEMPGLPRKESIFKTRWVDVRKLNYILKGQRNLIFVLTLDTETQGARMIRKFFTPESIEQIKSNPEQYYKKVPDVFARYQEVVYLFGPDEATLLRNLRKNPSMLVDHFNQKEKDRLTTSLFKSGQVKGITEVLSKEFRCEMKIPFGYKMADKQDDFLWVRQINPRDSKEIFVARKPYTSQEDFSKEKLVQFRDRICRKYLFGDPENPDQTYLMTEQRPYIPVTADTLNFNGHFAIHLTGLFRSNDMLLGGPFTGYALVDEGTHQFYYIEGFTISPSKDQREIVRELETILYTFRTSTELGK